MKNINNDKKFKQYFYEISKELLDPLIGNELVMQKRISLSISFQKIKFVTTNTLRYMVRLSIEAVAWLPLVNCYKTKSMYILPPPEIKNLLVSLKIMHSDSQKFKIIKKVVWLNLKYGQILIFNQQLPHGNVVNNEKKPDGL